MTPENHFPDATKKVAENPGGSGGDDRQIVRDSLPSPCRTVLSTRPLTEAEKAEVVADAMETRKRIIADLRKEGVLQSRTGRPTTRDRRVSQTKVDMITDSEVRRIEGKLDKLIELVGERAPGFVAQSCSAASSVEASPTVGRPVPPEKAAREVDPAECTPMGEYRCQIPMPINGRLQGIDYCIADIVAALNACNLRTVASCCGHGPMPGIISLEDGRELHVTNHVIPERRSKQPHSERTKPKHEVGGSAKSKPSDDLNP